MKTALSIVIGLTLLLVAITPGWAASTAWNDHAAPFSFLFGNHIDVHQQSRLVKSGKLMGFLYIKYTGELTKDGVPVAEHGNCGMLGDDCVAGWSIQGLPVKATLLEHQADQHPTWCLDPADVPSKDFSHFHWLGQPEHADHLMPGESYSGYLLKLTALDTFFFMHHGGFLVTPGVDTQTHANVRTDCAVME